MQTEAGNEFLGMTGFDRVKIGIFLNTARLRLGELAAVIADTSALLAVVLM